MNGQQVRIRVLAYLMYYPDISMSKPRDPKKTISIGGSLAEFKTGCLHNTSLHCHRCTSPLS
jgi:hypothetical protein